MSAPKHTPTKMKASETIRLQMRFKKACTASISMLLAVNSDDWRRMLMDAWSEGYRMGMQHLSAQTPARSRAALKKAGLR